MMTLTKALTGALLALVSPGFVLAAPNPIPAADSVASPANVPMSPYPALAAYHYGPLNRREATSGSGLNARKDPPNWTGGNNEVIHFFNCQKRPNWGFGTDSLVVICEDDSKCHDKNYLPPDDAICLMGRSEKNGVWHTWEGEVQGCLFMNYNNELTWNITKDTQKQEFHTSVGFLTSDTYVYEGFKDSYPGGLAVPYIDCQSIYYFKLRKDLNLVHGGDS